MKNCSSQLPVQPQGLADLRDGLRVGLAPAKYTAGSPGQRPRQDERDDDDPEHRRAPIAAAAGRSG